MRKIKVLIFALFACVFSGCTIEYNLEITDNFFKESIVFTEYASDARTKNAIYNSHQEWYPAYYSDTYPEQPVYIEEFEYHDKKFTELDNGYKVSYTYNYPRRTFSDARSLNIAFKNFNIIDSGGRLFISTDNFLRIFESNNIVNQIIINIKTTDIVKNNNADSVSGNTYTWIYNRSNYTNKSIQIETEINSETSSIISEEKIKNEKISISAIIIIISSFIGFGILLAVLIKIKAKSL